MKTQHHKNIRRRQITSGSFSWEVLIRRGGRAYRRSFLHRKHGGSREALRKAIRYRDRLLKKVGPPATGRHGPGTNTGIPGVSLNVYTKPSGTVVRSYVAFWHENNVMFRRAFSVAKYGEKTARQLAAQARRDGALRRLPRRAR